MSDRIFKWIDSDQDGLISDKDFFTFVNVLWGSYPQLTREKKVAAGGFESLIKAKMIYDFFRAMGCKYLLDSDKWHKAVSTGVLKLQIEKSANLE